eukprot:6146321-Pyramimonas_sp.AAC.1
MVGQCKGKLGPWSPGDLHDQKLEETPAPATRRAPRGSAALLRHKLPSAASEQTLTACPIAERALLRHKVRTARELLRQ